MSIDPATGKHRRGTSNGNSRGNTATRKARREYLVLAYRADVDVVLPGSIAELIEIGRHRYFSGISDRRSDEPWPIELGLGVPACRCYRCGTLLTVDTVTVDRIIPGCKGGTYRRNNIRPACGPCNSLTGGALASRPTPKRAASTRIGSKT